MTTCRNAFQLWSFLFLKSSIRRRETGNQSWIEFPIQSQLIWKSSHLAPKSFIRGEINFLKQMRCSIRSRPDREGCAWLMFSPVIAPTRLAAAWFQAETAELITKSVLKNKYLQTRLGEKLAWEDICYVSWSDTCVCRLLWKLMGVISKTSEGREEMPLYHNSKLVTDQWARRKSWSIGLTDIRSGLPDSSKSALQW